jgi:hypothetical protein
VSKEQKQKIKEIFTPDYVIEASKVISNSQDKDSVINVRDVQIKDLLNKIEALKTEHKKTLIEIAKQNKTAIQSTQKIDSISDYQQSRERKRKRIDWKGLHLYGGIESREFNFQFIEVNTELMYELNKFHIGVKAFALPDPNGTYQAGAGIKVRYKFLGLPILITNTCI